MISTNDEKKLIELIKKAGKDGILQRDLLKKLNIDSRKGSRILSSIERKGLITRKKISYRGKRTYLITIRKSIRTKIPEILKEIPCFSCPYLNRCGEGGSPDPRNCRILEEWLIKKIKSERK